MQPIYPPLADLTVESKPVPPPEIVTDDAVAAKYSIDLEAWGERGWRSVARICRWAAANGAKITCPEAGR